MGTLINVNHEIHRLFLAAAIAGPTTAVQAYFGKLLSPFPVFFLFSEFNLDSKGFYDEIPHVINLKFYNSKPSFG